MTSSSPKISIVTPSFNQASFLEATILSILNQDYPGLEYIILDGGSTDGSVEIIRKYEKHLKFWTSEKDNGQVSAINRGFSMCAGDVINWINSDDRLKPGALASLVEAIRSRPDAGAWVGSCDLVDEKGVFIANYPPVGLVRDEMAEWGVKGHFFQPACFLSRKIWEKFGPLDERLNISFDLDFYLKAIKEYKFFGTDTVWAEATIHKDAKTTARVPLMKAEICAIQVRHGYEKIAIREIEKAIKLAEAASSFPSVIRLVGHGAKIYNKFIGLVRKK